MKIFYYSITRFKRGLGYISLNFQHFASIIKVVVPHKQFPLLAQIQILSSICIGRRFELTLTELNDPI